MSLLSALTSFMSTDVFLFIMSGVLALFFGCFICSVVWGK